MLMMLCCHSGAMGMQGGPPLSPMSGPVGAVAHVDRARVGVGAAAGGTGGGGEVGGGVEVEGVGGCDGEGEEGDERQGKDGEVEHCAGG